MRTLIPQSDPSPNVDVHDFFSTDWLGRGGVRVNMIASVDGAIAVDGLSRGLQTPGDNQVFAALRDLSDVVLVGAGTARAENYRPTHPAGERLARRRSAGRPDELPIAVVSRSLRLDTSAELFAAASAARTIVLTCASADPSRLAEVGKLADVAICGDADVEPALVREALEHKGLSHILCEGGPTWFAELVRAGSVDEVCFSMSPLLVGPGRQGATAGRRWPDGPHQLELTGLLEQDGALFCRYRMRAQPQQRTDETLSR